MISGMYMGELIRQVLVDLMKDDLIFFGCNRDKLLERGRRVSLWKNEMYLTQVCVFRLIFHSICL